MGFFLGWIIAELDNYSSRSKEEVVAFAWVLSSIVGIGGYLLSIAARLNIGIPIYLVTEGWYLLGALVLAALSWFVTKTLIKSLG